MRSSTNARTHKELLVPQFESLHDSHLLLARIRSPAGRWSLAGLAIHGSAVSMSYSAVSHRTVNSALGWLVSALVQNSSALHASRFASLCEPQPASSGYICVRSRVLACTYLVAAERAISLTRTPAFYTMIRGTNIDSRGLLADTISPAVPPQTSGLSLLSIASSQ
jgi:hypothetical protein